MAELTADIDTPLQVAVLVTAVSSQPASHLPAYFTTLMTTLNEMMNITLSDVGAGSDDVTLVGCSVV